MEQMIWLAPWVLTEIWLSAFQTLMSVVAPLKENVTHPSSRHRNLWGPYDGFQALLFRNGSKDRTIPQIQRGIT